MNILFYLCIYVHINKKRRYTLEIVRVEHNIIENYVTVTWFDNLYEILPGDISCEFVVRRIVNFYRGVETPERQGS